MKATFTIYILLVFFVFFLINSLALNFGKYVDINIRRFAMVAFDHQTLIKVERIASLYKFLKFLKY